MSDPAFKDLLTEIEALHNRKSQDYANGEDPYINFKLSAEQVGITPGQSVEVLIATKQARLKELLGKGKDAQNESVRDTLVDRIVYSMIAIILYDDGHYKMTEYDPWHNADGSPR
jgi:hypothetical protein